MKKDKLILVIEDDDDMRITLVRMLKREGFHTIDAAGGEQALKAFKKNRFDLVLLDISLPDIDGISVAREIRGESNVPIIMVTGKSDVIDRVVGLEIGADDYLTKPFNSRELIARINTVFRRSDDTPTSGSSSSIGTDTVFFDGWKVDISACQLYSPAGSEIRMTTYEFRILSTFVTHPNRTLSRDQIADLMGFSDISTEGRSIDMLVGKVRKKIAEHSDGTQYIKTIRNRGYMFAGRPTQAPE